MEGYSATSSLDLYWAFGQPEEIIGAEQAGQFPQRPVDILGCRSVNLLAAVPASWTRKEPPSAVVKMGLCVQSSIVFVATQCDYAMHTRLTLDCNH